MAGGWPGSKHLGGRAAGGRRPQQDVRRMTPNQASGTEPSSDATSADAELARPVQTFSKHFGRSLWRVEGGRGRGWNTTNPGVDKALQSEPAVMPRELSGSGGGGGGACGRFSASFTKKPTPKTKQTKKKITPGINKHGRRSLRHPFPTSDPPGRRRQTAKV